ncbi:glycoside hydrolase family 2 protein [Paenibacillus sp. Dod16]|uniref:glycoside hydrolase family 2 protein n=1 Tax=Paenibacillus sp. Dod16 TaxID=3416392 RepID=UPI003CFB4C73
MKTSVAPSIHTEIPRAEYPRPDFERKDWLNLNGQWSFRLDTQGSDDVQQQAGTGAEGYAAALEGGDASLFTSEITVPFSWVSPLSGIERNEKGVGWYRRSVKWEPTGSQSRIFLRFGAVDYLCDVWVNGKHVGSHQGGYGTFEFDVTTVWDLVKDNTIVVRAEDFDHNYQARGKQGYGEIRGIWQPVWLEARPQTYLEQAIFTTSIDGRIELKSKIQAQEAGTVKLQLSFAEGSVTHQVEWELQEGANERTTVFQVHDPRLWSPETPHLYEGELRLAGSSGEDVVHTYFGIREIGTAKFDGRDYRWITLNGKPVYLNGTLDQSYHQTGFFTYPTDTEMRDEIYLMKRLGLNFVRIHIKPEEPRKLYWADKLGILVMEDMPCFWGNPDETARSAYEREALEVIERDRNHPSIFSWVMFNETWGLRTDSESAGLTGGEGQHRYYLPEIQEWVREKYRWAKELDPTRIVEDNSPCAYDHVETDINTWHFYINGYEPLRNHIEEIVQKTYPGSEHNYIGGNQQGDAPLMNSECGNVWGIDGGAGDSDLAWHYRYMLNEFRRHDKLCGFVFTEFRDVTNEFNGYYRLDGTDKKFGYEDFVPGMSIADLHTPDFIVIDAPPCQTLEQGAEAVIPLLSSSYSDQYHGQKLILAWELSYDQLGTKVVADQGTLDVAWGGYGVAPLTELKLRMPKADAVAILGVRLLNEGSGVVTRNFTTFDVRGGEGQGKDGAEGSTVSIPVNTFRDQSFAYMWEALQGSKVNGGGEGRFIYEVQLPNYDEQPLIRDIEIFFEAGAKRLLVRNIEGARHRTHGIDFMHGASADVEYNPSTYYMTDEELHESRVSVWVDDVQIGEAVLADDPADSRGVLSWHYQAVHNLLEEAGSYGYLCQAQVPGRLAAELDRKRSFRLELRAEEGGMSLYGRNAGRYPIDLLVRCR